MARDGHGLPKGSPEPAMPYHSMPAGEPPLKRSYGHFWGDPPAGQAAYGRLLPFWTPHAVHLWPGLTTKPNPPANLGLLGPKLHPWRPGRQLSLIWGLVGYGPTFAGPARHNLQIRIFKFLVSIAHVALKQNLK
jgi:hypothetical protein